MVSQILAPKPRTPYLCHLREARPGKVKALQDIIKDAKKALKDYKRQAPSKIGKNVSHWLRWNAGDVIRAEALLDCSVDTLTAIAFLGEHKAVSRLQRQVVSAASCRSKSTCEMTNLIERIKLEAVAEILALFTP